MRPTILFSIALALTLAAPARAQRLTGRDPGAVTTPVLLPSGKFEGRAARVGDDVIVAGQPNEATLHELQRQGFTTVVNIRHPSEMRGLPFDEPALVRSLGMRYIALADLARPGEEYNPAMVARLTEALKDAPGKVLVHCTIGWRASHLWAAYLVSARGLSVDSALANARVINLMDDMEMSPGRQPVESYLNRDLVQLHRKR